MTIKLRVALPVVLLPLVVLVVAKLLGPVEWATNHVANLNWLWVLSPLWFSVLTFSTLAAIVKISGKDFSVLW